jgi:hypothetical protein
MKVIFIPIPFLMTTIAFASNGLKKDDFSIYQRSVNGTDTLVMSKVNFVDLSRQMVTVATYRKNSSNGWSPMGSSQRPFSSSDYIVDITKFCSEIKGSLGQLMSSSDVIQSCKAVQEVGGQFLVTTYYAQDVPFGFIKRETVKKFSPGELSSQEDLIEFGSY